MKVSTKTLEGFVKEIDRIAPWFACSGSLTIPSWEKLKGDLVRELENGKLKAGNMPLWKLLRSCLKDEECQQVVKAGQRILDEIQDSLSEEKRGERVGAKRKHGAPIKHTGLSTGLEPEEKLMSGKNTWGEIGRKEKEKEKKKDQLAEVSRRRSLYSSLDELKEPVLNSSESDEKAIRAWKALSRAGEATGQLTKIVQRPQESFSDFVARMTEAAERIFGDSEQAAPLVE